VDHPAGSIAESDLAAATRAALAEARTATQPADLAAALVPASALVSTAVALTADDATIDEGGTATLTATVTLPWLAAETPTGSVEFADDLDTVLGTVALTAGVAELATADLAPGARTVTATYVPAVGAPWSGSTDTVAVQVAGATGTVLTVTPETAVVGASVALSAAVTPTTATGPVSGTVAFTRGETQIGLEIAVTAGVAATAVTDLPEGVHEVVATFVPASASVWMASASSPAITVTITAA
jgi:hypothetical protein